MTTHYKLVCSCGVVIDQCRCPETCEKYVSIRPDGCLACKAKKEAQVSAT